MEKKIINFKSSDGISLKGIITIPKHEAEIATILAHGITVEKNEGGFYTRLANLLAKNKITSLRFDFRGHGESAGKSWGMTIKGEIKDLSAAIDFLKRKGYKKIVIIGTSFGAGIAVLTVIRKSKKISSLVLLCPVLDYKRTFLKPETEWAQEWFTPTALYNANKTGKLNLDGFYLGKYLLKEFNRYAPGRVLLKLKIPVLIAHGTEDSMVPYNVSKYYAQKYEKGKFLSVKGADHGFEGFEKRVFSKIIKWIKNY